MNSSSNKPACSSQWPHWAVVGVVRLGCVRGTHWTVVGAGTLGYVWGTHWTAVGVLAGLSSFCMFMSCSHFLISWFVGLSVCLSATHAINIVSIFFLFCYPSSPQAPSLMRSHSVAQVDLEFEIFLPWLHEFWDFQHPPL